MSFKCSTGIICNPRLLQQSRNTLCTVNSVFDMQFQIGMSGPMAFYGRSQILLSYSRSGQTWAGPAQCLTKTRRMRASTRATEKSREQRKSQCSGGNFGEVSEWRRHDKHDSELRAFKRNCAGASGRKIVTAYNSQCGEVHALTCNLESVSQRNQSALAAATDVVVVFFFFSGVITEVCKN